MNRHERRAAKKIHTKELKTATFGPFQNCTHEAKIHGGFPTGYGPLIGFWKNDIYSVQAYQYRNSEYVLAGIRRHDERPICPWVHKQQIKNEIFGNERVGIEIFPRESEMVDEANIYWLWIYPEGEGLEFSLRIPKGIFI